MGTSWDIADLLGYSDKKPASNEPTQLPRRINIPLLPAVGAEFFHNLVKDNKEKYRYAMENERISGGSVIEIGTLSAEDARALITGISLNDPGDES